MTKIKNILLSILNIYSYLSIVLHELAHIIALLVTGSGLEKVEIKKSKNCDFSVTLTNKNFMSKRKVFLVAFAPFLVPVIFAVLSFFSWISLIIFVYLLTNFRLGRTLPSKTDFEAYRKYDETLDKILGFDCE
jgi:hypothetical protein